MKFQDLKSSLSSSIGLFLLCSVVFLFHYKIAGQAVYGDGIGYYAHLHSWVFDGNLDTTNEYQHIYTAPNNNSASPLSTDQVQIVPVTPNGLAANRYSPSVALLLLPGYLLAHVLGWLLHLAWPVVLNGYGDLYQIITGLTAVAYAVTGVIFTAKFLQKNYPQLKHHQLAATSIFLGSQLFYYGSFDVINSHFASFFLSAVFLWQWANFKDGFKQYFWLGVTAGLLGTCRPQDAFWPIVFGCWWLWQRTNHWHFSQLKLPHLAGLLLGSILTSSVWMVQTLTTFGQINNYHYWTDFVTRISNWPTIDIWGSYFHPIRGLFGPNPWLLFILIFGLVNRQRFGTKHFFLFTALLFLLIQTIIITLQGGWSAAAFGGRMYISSMMVFAICWLFVLNLIDQIFNQKASYFLALVMILANLFFMSRFVLCQKSTQNNSVGTEIATQSKLGSYPTLHFVKNNICR